MAHLGSKLLQVGRVWGNHGSKLRGLGPILPANCSKLVSLGVILAPSVGGGLGTILAPSWKSFGHLGSMLMGS